jgi:hypothetical protein
MSTPPPNKYFQTAVASPDTNMSATKLHPHVDRLPDGNLFKFTETLSQPRVIKVIVGADSATQRTWYLPKALLIRHSTYLAQLCTNSFRKEITLEDVDIRAFANFVDYMRSSIYTLNEQIPTFRRIHEGAKACLLGEKLGATTYSNAALSSLHMLFEPLARLKSSNMRMSTIRAEDIDFVCRNTDSNTHKLGSGVRRLFSDAVASHWSNWEVMKLTGPQSHLGKDMREWADLCTKYADFRITILTSCSKPDSRRKELFKTVHEYLDAEKPAIKKEEVVDGATTPLRSSGNRRIVNPRSLLLSLKRKGSSERRRKERAEAGQTSTNAQQGGNGNEEQGQDVGEVQPDAKQDWTMGEGLR